MNNPFNLDKLVGRTMLNYDGFHDSWISFHITKVENHDGIICFYGENKFDYVFLNETDLDELVINGRFESWNTIEGGDYVDIFKLK